MIISNKKHLIDHVNDGTIPLKEVVKFYWSKAPDWNKNIGYYEPILNTNDIPKDCGIKCRDNNFICVDVDHLHEYEDAQKIFNAIRDKYFNGATPSFNVNPQKYKLVFKITDSIEPLKKYKITNGINYINAIPNKDGEIENTIEFFGDCFKVQAIKTHGEYWKDKENLKAEDIIKACGKRQRKYNGKTYCHLGFYTDEFSIIELTCSEFCSFLDEIIDSRLFVINKTKDKAKDVNKVTETKSDEKLKELYDSLPNELKEHLENIANCGSGVSNSAYLENTSNYILDCIKLEYSLQECCYFMEQSLIARNIKGQYYSNFIEYATKLYNESRYFTKKQFNHALLSEELIKEFNIRKYNDNLYYWYDNLFKSDWGTFLTGIMQEKLPCLKINQKKEVLHHIKHSRSVTNIRHADVNYIAFKNGILNIDTGELLPPSADVFITNIIPHNYNANAEDSNGFVEQCLIDWSCGDKDIANLLVELAGYCLYRNCKFKKAFILYGDKNNGKSSYIDLLVNMLGKDNITSHDLKDLTNQFYRVTLKDKLANIGDDIQKSYTDSSDFKKIVSGDMISAKASHQDPIDFKPYCKLIFSCNDIPRLTDNTGAVNDRLIIIPFNADFSNKPNKNLRQSLAKEDVIEYFIKIAVEELKYLLKNDCFTISTTVEKEKEKYRIDNDSILSFINEWKEQDGDYSRFNRESIDTIYNYYENFCNDNKLKPKGKIPFSRKVCSELNFKVQRKMIQRHNESYFINK